MSDAAAKLLPPLGLSCLFLDFDGTLVDIAPTPDGIHVPVDLIDLLTALDAALQGRLALVSGRAISSIEQHLPAYGGVIVGGHGAEMRSRDRVLERLAGSDTDIDALHSWARETERRFPGVAAELKQTGAAMHFRQSPQHERELRGAVQDYLTDHSDLALQEAHMTVELRPKDANKARALQILMQSQPFADQRPIYAGDDVTDIPAMDYCRSVGGLAISVNDIYPAADIHRSTPQDVRHLLKDWMNSCRD